MRDLFLGPARHWAAIAVAVAALWALGALELHVRWFNLYIVAVLALGAALVGLVLATSKDARVTRDPIPPGGEDDSPPARVPSGQG